MKNAHGGITSKPHGTYQPPLFTVSNTVKPNQVPEPKISRIDATTQNKDFDIDALSGATLTSNGVDHLSAYWLGDAYKPFLEKLSKGEIVVNE